MSIAINRMKSRKGKAGDAAYVSRGFGIIFVRLDYCWSLLQDSLTTVLCYVGCDDGVNYESRPSGLPAGKEKNSIGSRAEGGYGYGKGVRAGAELGGYYLGSAGDRLVVEFMLYGIYRVFLYM